ncbi:MAG: CHASE2 domain-containing protein [Gammaproteobacteria bacterium]|nr:MAG: CHASE2 domain-containing protein [Gammaproteobacteria bacterium]
MNSRAHPSQSGSSRLWLATALTLIAITIGFVGRVGGLENLVYDYFQRYQYKTGSEQILLVSVDSRTERQKNVWTGQQFGEIVKVFDRLGARLIIATQPLHLPDVADEDQIRAIEHLQEQAQRVANESGSSNVQTDRLTEFRKKYDDRLALAKQLSLSNNILLSSHFTNFASEGRSIKNCAPHAVNVQGTDASALKNLNRVRHLTAPPTIICDSIYGIGFSNFWPDDDGIIRRADLVINADGIYLPSLALATNAAMDSKNSDTIVAASNALAIGEQIINTGPGLQILNRYYKGTIDKPAFKEVTLSSVLSGNVAPETINGRIILIGESTNSSMPGLATPIDLHMSPLTVTASILSNLLEGDYLLRPDWLPVLEIGVLIAVLLIALVWVPAMPTTGALLMGVILAMLVLSVEAWFLVAEGIWVQLATASVFTVIAIWTIQAWKLITSQPEPTIRSQRQAINFSNSGTQNKLDLEFSVLRQQAPSEETKEKMYEIAMLHGKAKEYARAEKVLMHIAELDEHYRDVKEILNKLSGARGKAPTRRKSARNNGSLDRRKLGRYEIERVLGRGAMATVYLGRDPAINRKVAIKTLALAKEFDAGQLEDARLQFRREAESAGRLNHPNIIAIYDTGEDDDVSYLAMEYFKGISLLEHARSDNLMPGKWVLELAARAAEALDYAHRQNVVHRDIKPANLMYHAATDTLKLTDFGIARLTDNSRTKTGIILGTPSYMSPEQLSAAGVTGQSDLYSLGVTIYQLLTGNAPFRADSIPKLMDKILNEEATPISKFRNDIPRCVDEILKKSMAKKPAQRFATGREMAIALRECAKTF